jgi:hypothetical protein
MYNRQVAFAKLVVTSVQGLYCIHYEPSKGKHRTYSLGSNISSLKTAQAAAAATAKPDSIIRLYDTPSASHWSLWNLVSERVKGILLLLFGKASALQVPTKIRIASC